MAGVLETFTIPRVSGLHDASSLPIRSQSVSSVSGCQKPANLTQFRGLKFGSTYSNNHSLVPFGSTSRTVTRRGRIACEAAVEVANVNEANWQNQVLDSDSPVLVEFWAPWCGPCRMITPIIDELAKEYTGKLKCYKVNTDESPSVATRYGIRSIPTVIIFKGGEKKDAIIGAVPKSTLTTSIEKFL